MDHRREWFCPHCNLVYHDKLKARMHIIQHYDNSDGHHQADLLLQTSSRLPEYLSADDCPFCDWSATLRKRNIASKEFDLKVPSRRFMKHLGRHLEEIALFVVPQPEEDQFDSDNVGSNAVHAAQGEESATNSTLSSFNSKRPSVASIRSQNSLHDESNRVLCPYPGCGRHIKNLLAHMLTHSHERPEKCPVPTCEYHAKGFARIYDRRRHTLTHYKGTMVCGFCPNSVTPAEKSFNRVDVFNRHLTSSHGVVKIPPNVRRHTDAESSSDDIVHATAGDSSTCSTCGNAFSSAQQFYEHLDECVLSFIDLQGYQTQLRSYLNLKRRGIPREEVESMFSRPNRSPSRLARSGSKSPSDFQAEQSPPPDEWPPHSNRSSSPHQSLAIECLQAANALRSSPSPSASVERSPSRSGSPLAPRQTLFQKFQDRSFPGTTGHLHIGDTADFYRPPYYMDEDPVDSPWGSLQHDKPRERSMGPCVRCRQQKLICDPGTNSCLQCEEVGRRCRRRYGDISDKQAEDTRQTAKPRHTLPSGKPYDVTNTSLPSDQNLLSEADQDILQTFFRSNDPVSIGEDGKPYVLDLLDGHGANQSELRSENRLEEATLRGSANTYDKQLLDEVTSFIGSQWR